MKYGAEEGRNPHRFFWTTYYRDRYLKDHVTTTNPLVHYLNAGWRQGFDPHPLFDTDWYLRSNPDVASADINPFVHYLRHGAAEKRSPHPLFDSGWYSERANVIHAAELLDHYIEIGAWLGLDPHPFFDSSFYLDHNPDLRKAGVNPLVHYLLSGAALGCNPNAWFDNNAYLDRYEDVRSADVNPLVHYRLIGHSEGRDASSPLRTDILLSRFESIGENCEFGLVQKYFGANQVGLFKFPGASINDLIVGLLSGFKDLTAPDHFVISVDDTDRDLFVYKSKSTIYNLTFYAGMMKSTDAEILKRIEMTRLNLLRRKFLEDLSDAAKIFVFKSNQDVDVESIRRLLRAMHHHGAATLLWVTLAVGEKYPGLAEKIDDKFYRGYIDRFAPGENAGDFSEECWKTLCINAWTLFEAASASQSLP
jgi:hypothetical protein